MNGHRKWVPIPCQCGHVFAKLARASVRWQTL